MLPESVKELPIEAFQRGVKRLKKAGLMKGVLVLGLDCEYDSVTQEIIAFQVSDGERDAWIELYENPTWKELSEWVMDCAREWGYGLKHYSRIVLASFFSTAELSHIADFHVDAEVRRVSPQQVFNTNYRYSKRHNIQVFDLYHFFNTSLARVADTWGEEKLDYDTRFVRRETLQDPKFIEYMLWDARICARILNKFRDRVFQDFAIDVLNYPTPASLAMAVYRLHYLEEDLAPPRPRIRKQGWLSLWGGRAEAYHRGDFYGDYTLRDVKSLYPTACINLEELPRAEDWIERDGDPVTWQGLCSVSFRFPRHVKFPCLPVTHNGKLIFPLQGRSNCTLDEARLARSLGAELKFHRVMEYERGDGTLKLFMEDQMVKKDEATRLKDKAGRDLAKLLMNSLIGKFSQNRGEADLEDFKKHAEEQGFPLEFAMSPKNRHPDKPDQKFRIGGYIMPEWSALILGRSRMIMAHMMNSVGESLICSTDSMLIPSELNGLATKAMKEVNVLLENKNDPCDECGGLAKTVRVRVVRNRVYAAECPHGNIAFMANHGIHMRRKDAFHFIWNECERYVKVRRAGLKTAVRTGKQFFSESYTTMTFRGGWDNKRLLLDDGSSRPWKSVKELDARVNTQSSNTHTYSVAIPPGIGRE